MVEDVRTGFFNLLSRLELIYTVKKIIEKIFKFPAQQVHKSLHISKYVSKFLFKQKPTKLAEEYWKKLGPGLTTGAADDDPSGIATYSQTGAQYGFQLVWLALFTYPLMAVVQEMCARIGLQTGRGLAANIRTHFPKKILYISTVLLFAANVFNIGADLGAMAQATQLVIPSLPFGILVVFFTLFSAILQIFTSYKMYAKYLKWLALILFSYIATAFIIHLNWPQILYHTAIPSFSFSKASLILIAAILGTTISPYLFFWQTSQEVEEDILKGKTTIQERIGTTSKDIKDMRIDVWSGMFISNLVMFFIIVVCSATLFSHGIVNINTAADAAKALRPLAGNSAYFLFAIGIIGTGLLAVPVLAGSASYAISESLNWKMGLYRKLQEAYAFYGVIIIAMLMGLILNFIHLDPIKALIYSAVANCIVSPIVLILIVLISSSKKIMKENVNKPNTTVVGWIVVFIMIAASIGTIVSLF